MREPQYRRINADCIRIMSRVVDRRFDVVIADPPYGNGVLINAAVEQSRRICRGASFFFMYAEDITRLDQPPDQVLFWVKPVSTKNTYRRYSRFVEVIVAYDIARSPFLQDTHWSVRTGVFTDTLVDQDHAHSKPDSLIEKLLRVNCKPHGLVLDPFAGSHTVEKVCKRLGYSCVSIEVSP